MGDGTNNPTPSQDGQVSGQVSTQLTRLALRLDRLEQSLTKNERVDRAILTLAIGTASAKGQEFFTSLARQITAILDVQYVYFTEWVPGRLDRIRTVGAWSGNHAGEPVEYNLLNTPCQKVIQEGEAFFPEHVKQLFPEDAYLTMHNIESYMGIALRNKAGRALGHLCVMDVRPFSFDQSEASIILQMIATRAAAELDQLQVGVGLQDREARLYRFVADAPIGLVMFDEQQRIICANKAFCALTGYTEPELLGQTYAIYTHPEDLAGNLRLTDEFFRGVRENYTIEKRCLRKSGEIIWVQVTVAQTELLGRSEPVMLAAVHDITEKRWVEEERERLSQDLHDHSLQALYGVGMQLEAVSLLSGRLSRRVLTHMNLAITQLKRLMGDIRGFITVLERKPGRGQRLEDSLKELFSALSTDAQQVPEFHIDEGVEAKLTSVQSEQLLNIVREAFSNSLRHSHATTRSVHLCRDDRGISLMIADNGVGFDITRRITGGHGLANMKARAAMISAEFTVDSAPGKGTSITVQIPGEYRTSVREDNFT